MTVDRAEAGRILLGASLRKLRQESAMTLADLAEKSGVSLSYTSDVERGRKAPTLETLDALAVAMKTDVVSILQGVYPYGASRKPRSVVRPRDGRSKAQ